MTRTLRLPLSILALCGALAAASCGSTAMVGAGTGASRTAVGYMADIRAANGLSPLVSDPKLERAALQQAAYMARSGRMVHTTGWRKDFAARMDANGIEGPAAENIAAGRMELGKVVQMWMDSPPHRRNMLDPRIGRFGLAYVPQGRDGTRYWALVLGK